MRVEVFKTNVQKSNRARSVLQKLLEHFPDYKINFDLDDCDKILRIEAEKICVASIITLVASQGILITVLEE